MGISVHHDAHIRVLGLKFGRHLIKHGNHAGGLPGIGVGETGGEKAQGYGFVRAEKVAVLHGETAHVAVCEQILEQGVPQAQRIHAGQLGVVSCLIFHDQLVVGLHLLCEGFRFQGGVNVLVPGRINECGQVREAEIHRFHGGVYTEPGQRPRQVMRGTVPFHHGVAELLCHLPQFLGGDRIQRIP